MADQFLRPYLDANVYISAIKGPAAEPPGRAEVSAEVLQLAENGSYQIFASTFIHAEVIRAEGVGPLASDEAAKIDAYLDNDFIVWVELDIPLAKAARDLARTHGLKPGDAVHAATAIRAGCDQLLTWDANLHKGGRTIESVFVTEPHTTGWQVSML